MTSNNLHYGSAVFLFVVNYFQNLYLCDFQQQLLLLYYA
nr:MAG TPA: hypothetical protein [Caudoviricetes sp.]